MRWAGLSFLTIVSTSPQKVFHLGCPVVAVLQPHHLWRSAAGFREVEKIGISRYDGEPMGRGILPNHLVRGEPGETGVENVNRIGKELGEAMNEFRREIRIKQKLQGNIRSRPVCEAYA